MLLFRVFDEAAGEHGRREDNKIADHVHHSTGRLVRVALVRHDVARKASQHVQRDETSAALSRKGSRRRAAFVGSVSPASNTRVLKIHDATTELENVHIARLRPKAFGPMP